MPPEVLGRGKQGLAVPLARWFRGPLSALLRDTLCAPAGRRGYFPPGAVDRMVNDHVPGKAGSFNRQLVGHPLMVDPRGVYRLLHRHLEIDNVQKRLQNGVDDRGAAGAAEHHEELSLSRHDCGRHCAQRAFPGGDRVCFAMNQTEFIGRARLGAEVIHLVVH